MGTQERKKRRGHVWWRGKQTHCWMRGGDEVDTGWARRGGKMREEKKEEGKGEREVGVGEGWGGGNHGRAPPYSN